MIIQVIVLFKSLVFIAIGVHAECKTAALRDAIYNFSTDYRAIESSRIVPKGSYIKCTTCGSCYAQTPAKLRCNLGCWQYLERKENSRVYIICSSYIVHDLCPTLVCTISGEDFRNCIFKDTENITCTCQHDRKKRDLKCAQDGSAIQWRLNGAEVCTHSKTSSTLATKISSKLIDATTSTTESSMTSDNQPQYNAEVFGVSGLLILICLIVTLTVVAWRLKKRVGRVNSNLEIFSVESCYADVRVERPPVPLPRPYTSDCVYHLPANRSPSF